MKKSSLIGIGLLAAIIISPISTNAATSTGEWKDYVHVGDIYSVDYDSPIYSGSSSMEIIDSAIANNYVEINQVLADEGDSFTFYEDSQYVDVTGITLSESDEGICTNNENISFIYGFKELSTTDDMLTVPTDYTERYRQSPDSEYVPVNDGTQVLTSDVEMVTNKKASRRGGGGSGSCSDAVAYYNDVNFSNVAPTYLSVEITNTPTTIELESIANIATAVGITDEELLSLTRDGEFIGIDIDADGNNDLAIHKRNSLGRSSNTGARTMTYSELHDYAEANKNLTFGLEDNGNSDNSNQDETDNQNESSNQDENQSIAITGKE